MATHSITRPTRPVPSLALSGTGEDGVHHIHHILGTGQMSSAPCCNLPTAMWGVRLALVLSINAKHCLGRPALTNVKFDLSPTGLTNVKIDLSPTGRLEIDAVRKDRGGMNPDEWGKQIAGVSRAPPEKTERDDEGRGVGHNPGNRDRKCN
jgi:hypothetical protein